ncbi:hypothetical protein [Phenylobacterium sp.]|uniref:hypothetical protein n=1 Tax=Phenylobacterium sp. TaxID=1871053 RepID=UPI003784BF8B
MAVKRGSRYIGRMIDRLYLPLLGLAAALAIGLAMVWPQGYGARSPAPFGHTPVQQTPAMKAAMQRQIEAAQARVEEAREAVRDLQAQAIAPTE